MPEPTMPPITSMVASKRPSFRASFCFSSRAERGELTATWPFALNEALI